MAEAVSPLFVDSHCHLDCIKLDEFNGDFDTLIDSIRRELLTLPDETIAYCGHGPQTTIGRERAHNPFITGAF